VTVRDTCGGGERQQTEKVNQSSKVRVRGSVAPSLLRPSEGCVCSHSAGLAWPRAKQAFHSHVNPILQCSALLADQRNLSFVPNVQFKISSCVISLAGRRRARRLALTAPTAPFSRGESVVDGVDKGRRGRQLRGVASGRNPPLWPASERNSQRCRRKLEQSLRSG
jgi:hypothetical protein